MDFQLTISENEFQLIRNLVYDNFGINLGDHKKGLVVGRLRKVLIENGFANFGNYYDFVKSDSSGKALTTLIDKISTNHTYFYREKQHFNFLSKSALPEITHKLEKEKNKNLRIWCAGCSSGEESYTLSMALLEYFGNKLQNWEARILATDISLEILNRAKEAIYPDSNVSNIPNSLKHKFFQKFSDDSWTLKENVKDLILFKRFNLMQESFPFKGKFHIIFCRNVMIYFDQTTRNNLINKFYEFTTPGGYLFIGLAESLNRTGCPYTYVKPGVYKKELS